MNSIVRSCVPEKAVTDTLIRIIKLSNNIWKDTPATGISKEEFMCQPFPKKNVLKGDGDGVFTDKKQLITDEYSPDKVLKDAILLGDLGVVTNSVFYPSFSMMPWHTNSDNIGIRTYFTYTNKEAIFRWRNPQTKEIITEKDEIGWTKRQFIVLNREPYLWHTVWSEGVRFAFGFNKSYKQ
tara:strand:+ start:1320 stop:1862 length:543 start_codon:yes stop_codon:yes gene_type:complete